MVTMVARLAISPFVLAITEEVAGSNAAVSLGPSLMWEMDAAMQLPAGFSAIDSAGGPEFSLGSRSLPGSSSSSRAGSSRCIPSVTN